MAEAAQPDLSLLAEIPDKDLEDIVAAIHDGAKHPGDALGFGEEALNAIEQMALGFYRGKLYDRAAVVYGFVLQMKPTRSTAWRGLGACCHALSNYALGAVCYEHALEINPGDVVARVYLGECQCLLGDKETGLAVLNDVIARGSKDAACLPYITRARAVVGAGGGMPSRLVLMRSGKALAAEASEALAAEQPALEGDEVQLDDTREVTFEDMQRNPELKKLMTELAAAVGEGRLTLAAVGGFSATELEGAYACACKYADMGQVVQAIQIAGYLMFLDPYNARYYQLVGICLQRMKQYEAADQYYRLATTLEPDNAMTLVYRGESKIMAGNADEGLELVRQGITAAEGNPDFREIADRGQVLVRQFGG